MAAFVREALLTTPGNAARVLTNGAELSDAPNMVSFEEGVHDHFHSYEELTSLLQALSAPESPCNPILRCFSIGRSQQGRELWAVRLTDNPDVEEDEPEFLYAGNIHGDENLGRELLIYLIQDICDGYAAGDSYLTWLVQETDVYIIVSLNPDGFEARTRGNANDVDLNRNFPDQIVGQPSPMQPETLAMVQFLQNHTFALGATLHAGALVCNFPWDGLSSGRQGNTVASLSPDDVLYRRLCSLYSESHPSMHESRKYSRGIVNGAQYFAIYGGLQDWSYAALGMLHVTLELGETKSLNSAQLQEEWISNREALYLFLEQVQVGVRGRVTCACPGGGPSRPASATLSFSPVDGAAAAPCDIGARPLAQKISTRTDRILGDYHRVLLPGDYMVSVEGVCGGNVTASRNVTVPVPALYGSSSRGGRLARVSDAAVDVDFGLVQATGCSEERELFQGGSEATPTVQQAWSGVGLAHSSSGALSEVFLVAAALSACTAAVLALLAWRRRRRHYCALGSDGPLVSPC